MASFRKERVSDLLIAYLARKMTQLRDPNFTHVTLTGVEMAPDLKTARVYWSGFAPKPDAGYRDLTPAEVKSTNESFDNARAILQRDISRELGLRYTPKLSFRFDESGPRGARIDAILDQLARERNDA